MKTFKIGGVHPPENKLSRGKQIQRVGLPKQAIISLNQNLGAPSVAVVKKGDLVKVGTLLANPGGFVGASIHSPFSGKVIKVEEALDASGYRRPAIYIDVEGDEWEESIDCSDELNRECTLSQEEIKTKISQAGIVGLGGATFPTHVKLSPPPGFEAKELIINAVECEPYLTSDHQLMMEYPHQVLIGVEILKQAIGVERAYIGIEENKPDAIKLLSKLAKAYKNITVVALKVQYPQGGEKQLIDAVLGKEVPSGALPVSVGAVVQNVGTAFAVYEAVQKNKPLIERVVTVTGKKVTEPCNLMSRIGTPIIQLIEMAGGVPEGTGKIILGGPMMGKAIASTDVPTSKGCSGILMLPNAISTRKEMSACIRCAKCVDACPMGLEPYLLMNLSEKEMYERCEKERIVDCIECGCCAYTCPANRPLLDFVRIGKSKTITMIRARK